MRTDIHFRLVCSACGSELEADSDNNKTNIKFNSAYNAEANMAIKPCNDCMIIIKRPLALIKQTLELIDKDNSLN